MAKLFILDASGYLFRAYHAIAPMTNDEGMTTHALFGFLRSIGKLKKDFTVEHLVVVFDGPKSIESRKKLYAEYKAHRTKTPEDLLQQIAWAKQACALLGIPLLDLPGVEADDVMGSVAVLAKEKKWQVRLCTTDKDMAQLVTEEVQLLDTFRGNQELGPEGVAEKYGVAPEQIQDLLALMGDSSDNVPGVRGIGPKGAKELLAQYGSLEGVLEHIDEIKGAKRQQMLREDRDLARLSKQLVRVDTTLKVPEELSFYQLQRAKGEEVGEFLAKMGFRSLREELVEESMPLQQEEKTFYQTVESEEALRKLVAELSSEKVVCIDTETTSTDPFTAKLVGIGFCWKRGVAYYVPFNGKCAKKEVFAALQPILESGKIQWVGHNIKYDLHVLRTHGICLRKIGYDTILASYLLAAERRSHSLDALAQEYFHFTKTPTSALIGKGRGAITMADVPIERVSAYCGEDVDYTWRLKERTEKELQEEGLDSLFYEMELPLLSVLAKMEERGIYLDAEMLAYQGEEVAAEIEALKEKIYTAAEGVFNINSPKQLGVVLFEQLGLPPTKKTTTGYSTSADALELLRGSHPIVDLVLEYRTLSKLQSTYIEALPQQIDPRDGRVHCQFDQFVAATGRLSCRDPNLQNIPVRTEAGRKIRAAFRPQEAGYCYLSADYSQIELRLLAHMSRDPTLLAAFTNGADIHRETAAAVFNISPEEVTPEMRYQAKAVNFGILYGQQAFGLARELGISRKMAAAFIDQYFARFSHVQGFLEQCKAEARERGYAKTLLGRKRKIPELTSNNAMIRGLGERLAVNTPLQGTTADLTKRAMLRIAKLLEREGDPTWMILQIHDELLFELPEERVEEWRVRIQQEMEDVLDLAVPLVVDTQIGKNWAEC